MAEPPHCLFCFESLAASLEKRRSLDLPQVQELWHEYQHALVGRPDGDTGATEDLEMENDVTLDEEPMYLKPSSNKLAATRLAEQSMSSLSSSSTPSSTSASSRQTWKQSPTPASSSNSSHSSFFSLPSLKNRHHSSRKQNIDRPLFVTWNAVSKTGKKSLRGCIGTFEPHDAESGLRSYALTSAFEDSRFLPVQKRELPQLEVGVTFLTDFETASTPTSWDLGTHGIRLSFIYHSKRYGATYLPDVPIEQGWTKEETLISLMRKAGWTGREHEWQKVSELRVTRYQGRKLALTYHEFDAWRNWVDEKNIS